MDELALVMAYSGALFVIALFAIVVVQLLSGAINTSGLLLTKQGRNKFSAERLQLLLATGALAWFYLFQVFENPAQLPGIPAAALGILGASHGLYLGRKYYQHQH